LPDWVTHLGTTYLGARAVRISMVRPLLLGALLPDITRCFTQNEGKRMTGTFINIVAVLIGGTIGSLLGARLPDKIRDAVMSGLGLMTIVLGMSMALESQNLLIVMGSVLLGGVLGEWWRIEDGLESAGRWLENRFRRPEDTAEGRSITRAFVTASLVLCVGPLAVVGSILDGLTGNYQPLALKSMLDGFASLAFGASLGPGVLFSTLTILIYQGGLSLSAKLLGANLAGISAETPAVIEMGATGGVLIMGIGLILLDLKRIRIGNFLPAIAIAPLAVILLERLGIAF
jgi:uncharacterized membrane protein YqgA involved in biofilm formation